MLPNLLSSANLIIVLFNLFLIANEDECMTLFPFSMLVKNGMLKE